MNSVPLGICSGCLISDEIKTYFNFRFVHDAALLFVNFVCHKLQELTFFVVDEKLDKKDTSSAKVDLYQIFNFGWLLTTQVSQISDAGDRDDTDVTLSPCHPRHQKLKE